MTLTLVKACKLNWLDSSDNSSDFLMIVKIEFDMTSSFGLFCLLTQMKRELGVPAKNKKVSNARANIKRVRGERQVKRKLFNNVISDNLKTVK